MRDCLGRWERGAASEREMFWGEAADVLLDLWLTNDLLLLRSVDEFFI